MENETQRKIYASCILKDIKKDLWVALSLAVSFVMLLYIAVTVVYRPNYTSSTTFVISERHKVLDETLNMNKIEPMTDSFQSIMTNPMLKKRAAERMGEKRFPGSVSVAVVPQTNLITVSVHAKSPELAFQGLKSIMECYPELGEKVLGDMVLDVFETPVYPSEPDVNLRGGKIMLLCFLGVFFGTLLLIALASYMKETVKSEKEVPILLDTTLFGMLHHEREYQSPVAWIRRKKQRIYINDAYVSFGYKERVKKICTKLLYRMEKRGQQVVLITSAEGGEGKSVVAMNLAQAISQRSKNVLLIDGNLRNPGLAKCMHISAGKKNDWCAGASEQKDIKNVMVRPDGFSFNLLVCGRAISHPVEFFRKEQVRSFLKDCRKNADVVIIDGPCVNKRPDLEVLAKEADVSLLVVKQNETEAKYINDAIDLLESYECRPLGCIYNDAIRQKDLLASAYGYGSNYGYGKYAKNYDEGK